MTDPYGRESHDHDEHDLLQDDGHDLRGEAPSGDEFATANEHSEEHDLPPASVAGARRSAFLPIAAAVGGVLILGVVAWFQFSSGSPQAGAAPATTLLPAGAPVKSQAEAQVDNAPIPIAPKVAAGASPEPAPVAVASPAPIPVAIPMPTATVPSPVGAIAPVPVIAPMPPSPVATTADPRLDVLSARIDSLQRALDQANQQLSQVANMAAASTSAAPMAPDKQLQDKVDHLEKELADMRNPNAVPGLSTPMQDSMGIVATPTRQKKVSTHHVSHKPAVAAVAVHEKPKKSVETIGWQDKWVLRAASPLMAWISPTPTSRDLKEVHVGDTLPGVGRVTAIEQQGDRWIVRGTKASVQ